MAIVSLGCVGAFLIAATAVGGCTRSGTQDAAAAVADPALQQILRHVPADTHGVGAPVRLNATHDEPATGA